MYASGYSAVLFDEDFLSIPFSNDFGLMLIEGSCLGEEGYFILDSGADALILNSAVFGNTIEASSLNTSFTTLSGEIKASSTAVPDLMLGKHKFENATGYIGNLRSLESLCKGNLLGILGNDFFTTEIIHIDNLSKTIKLYSRKNLSDLSNYGAIIRSKLIIDKNLLLLPLQIDGKEQLFILDTGASVSLIDKNFASTHSEHFSNVDKTFNYLTADTYSKRSDIYKLPSANLGKLKILDLELGTVDLSTYGTSLPENVAGILSIAQLPVSDLLIDLAAQRVYLLFRSI